MANRFPMWWVAQNSTHSRRPPPVPPAAPHAQNPVRMTAQESPQEVQRESPPECTAAAEKEKQAVQAPEKTNFPPPLSDELRHLRERFRHMDSETMLLLALLWMLRQEHADRKLLLALAYIVM